MHLQGNLKRTVREAVDSACGCGYYSTIVSLGIIFHFCSYKPLSIFKIFMLIMVLRGVWGLPKIGGPNSSPYLVGSYYKDPQIRYP